MQSLKEFEQLKKEIISMQELHDQKLIDQVHRLWYSCYMIDGQHPGTRGDGKSPCKRCGIIT